MDKGEKRGVPASHGGGGGLNAKLKTDSIIMYILQDVVPRLRKVLYPAADLQPRPGVSDGYVQEEISADGARRMLEERSERRRLSQLQSVSFIISISNRITILLILR